MTKLPDSKYTWWVFAIAIVFVYLYGLHVPLVGPDEPRYAQVAREMFDRGDWISPTLGGYDWFEKPALLYWLQIVGYKVFGVNEFASRFGSALFGLGTVASMWLLGRFSNFDTDRRETIRFANLLSLITATSLGILVFSHAASFDIIVTFPLTASLAGFFIADRSAPDEDQKRNLGFFAFYFFAGLAVLAKGLIGIVFPFGIVGVYFVLSRRFASGRFLLSLIWGFPTVLIVAAVWNVPMYLQHGWKFIDEFYIQHHFQRYTSNKYQHPQPFYFYFWVLPVMSLPWLPWFFAGIYSAFRKLLSALRNPTVNDGDVALSTFATAWIIVPLLFFSASGSKLPGYIVPALCGAAVVTAMNAKRSIKQARSREYLVFGTAAVLVLAVAAALIFALPNFADKESVKRLIQTADAAGFAHSEVISFRTISHNAEFYAEGRLIRGEDGKQIRFEDPKDLESAIGANGGQALVLVPLKQLDLLKAEPGFSLEVLADNSDLAIVNITVR
jgi:4-amino-4-deoxy-L-arabinose transferase-like glycosyltransferase